jgi:hypothetical protein
MTRCLSRGGYSLASTVALKLSLIPFTPFHKF